MAASIRGMAIFLFAILCSLPSVYTYDYECNYPLLERAHLKATSSLAGRGPENARLHGDSAWSPESSSYDHHIIVDLGGRYEIRSIATRGRSNTNEFVTEYIVQFSEDAQAWISYENQEGTDEMFKGNVNGDTIKLNRFEVPIIAQWIRINPTRWRDRIALRMELYGCEYESNLLSFNGSSLVRWDLLREPIQTDRHSLRFRFKTNTPDGVILYSRGTQGDFLALQLRDNRMLLNLDLGSGITTSLSVGSLLDDNMWHDVVISRNRKDISFSVDRVLIQGKIKGEFHRLDLNRAFYLGGVPNIQKGLVVYQNFTGCIENLYLNTTNLLLDLRESEITGENLRYFKVNTKYNCPEPPIIPVTFLTPGSYAKLRGLISDSDRMNVSLSFRTYGKQGVILYHQFSTQGDYVKLFLDDSKLKVEIKTEVSPLAILDNFEEHFNDGKWHQVILAISENTIILNVDGRPTKTKRVLKIKTGPDYYYIGGVDSNNDVSNKNNKFSNFGFVGCMRMISIDGNYKLPTDWTSEDFCCKNEIVFDSCQMVDRCNPNPCKHHGICSQTSDEFICDCSHTGYSGGVCHTPKHPLSCEVYEKKHGQRIDTKIDVDGSGPLKPFPVTCDILADGTVRTILHHNNELLTPVDGYEEPGSFTQDIEYDAEIDQIVALMNRSTACAQRLTYACKHSKLFNTPVSQTEIFRPNSWWVGRNNQKMDYWGGALPGSRKCECGVYGTCSDPTKWCNCDANLDSWSEDSGEITEMEHLPVTQLRFGDTGTPLDDKAGRYTLGPLICEGDDLFNNVMTFRISDATIRLPTFDMGHSGDIYFEFKTTMESGVIIHSKGPTDYIKVSILDGNQIRFQYQAGGGPVTVSVQSSSRLANNEWHSVLVERNRKEARILVDSGQLKGEVREPPGPIRALHLTSELVVGATIDDRDGYVGCIRALLLNGKLQDIQRKARETKYGVSEGCVGKCDSSPCLNNGTCLERYDGYGCDCRWTAYKGRICADEIGVNMRTDSMIRYDFIGDWRSSLSEEIEVGFTTTNPKGFLLGFFSNVSGEYMTIAISNSGHLRVVYDFGFERQEAIYPKTFFALGQYHTVRITRKNAGQTLVMQVDDYEPHEHTAFVKASADAQFNNIQYMYIGRNESMNEGFIGCISRVKFSEIYPLKLFFQQDRPRNLHFLGGINGSLSEDFCGVEPVTHPPNIVETRPPPLVDEDKVRAAYNETDTAILGSVLAVIFIALIIMAVLIGRYMARHKGEYLTQEDKGAEIALDPDSAVVNSTTGHQVQKKKEWFI